ncbi:MAG: circularly permuted type 2 ATP-grasp protein [Oceanococcaceae bacterium]
MAVAKRYRPLLQDGFFDDLATLASRGESSSRGILDFLLAMAPEDLAQRRDAAEAAVRTMGITFTVYSEAGAIDRMWPFDIVPRVILLAEWMQIEAGLKQRVRALNAFINDIYNDQQIIKDGVFPAWVLEKSVNFREECRGMHPAHGVWAHICGSDLVRGKDGTVYVLEDNLRVPSGVSYMLENRAVMKRTFPELFENHYILPVDEYPSQLYESLAALSPRDTSEPSIVVLTPGIFNSAYFEHSYLAQQMGVELVEGADLFVADDDCVYMRTVHGPLRVDVIYRRIDDLFLDPEVFRPDSTLGVPGLMRAWRAGNVAMANAPGSGVADDKVVYAFVPDIVRYYLNEEPQIANVPTWQCADPDQCAYVLDHLEEVVVKPANESGGYGLLIGPHSSASQRKATAASIRKDPRNWIAQPCLNLSTTPTLVGSGADCHLAPRHVDLRPFILSSAEQYVTMGGLTRVALREGSLVVNSSQGGGSKDTWIVDPDGEDSA